MSLKEADQLSVMRQIDKKVLSLKKAAEELGISLRQARRIRKRYLKEGERGLISKHKGKISPNRIDPKLRATVTKILSRAEYAGFGPTLAKEKLRRRHGYYLSEETLRKWMIEADLWEAKSRSERKVYQRWTRRARFGELLQGDGSRHAWLKDRGTECTLVIFVDNATSQLTAGRFVEAETCAAYQQILEEHLTRYGRPLGLYTDKHAIFRVTREQSSVQKNQTQFARVLKELEIELICAHSPQAKGRVERANGVLQDRLIKEMRLSKLSKSLSFQYEGVMYQLQPKTPNRFRRTHVNILKRPGKPILVESQGEEQPYVYWAEVPYEQPKIVDSKELEAYWPDPTRKKPNKHHPWKKSA